MYSFPVMRNKFILPMPFWNSGCFIKCQETHSTLILIPHWSVILSISSGARKNDVKAHTSFCRDLIVLPGACYFNLSSIYNLYVLFVKISYQARFCLQISYPAILFKMLMGCLNRGSFISHILLPGTSKAFTLSVFLSGTRVYIVLPGTQRYVKWISKWFNNFWFKNSYHSFEFPQIVKLLLSNSRIQYLDSLHNFYSIL